MELKIKIKRGTRAQLNAAASASGLIQGELYLITDEDKIAVGLSATTYEVYAKDAHTHTLANITDAGNAAAKDVGTGSNDVAAGNAPAAAVTAHETDHPAPTNRDTRNEAAIGTKGTAFNKNFGTATDTVCEGNDSRLSDARTPTAHTHTKATGAEINTGTDDEKFATSKAISDSTLARIIRGTSSTAATVAAKTTTIPGYTLRAGDTLAITFTTGFAANNPTLNVNNSGAIAIRVGAINVTSAFLSVGGATSFTLNLYYDGTHFYIPGSQVNTTYQAISTAEIDAGTATTARSITAQGLKYAFDNVKAALAAVAESVTWANVSSKPTTFAPESHDNSAHSTNYSAFDGTKVVGINPQTGTTYTLVLADAGKYIRMNNTNAIALTVPLNADVAFETGTVITVIQIGAGVITVGGADVTLNALDDGLSTAGQYAAIQLIKVDTNTWDVGGGVA